MRVGLVQMTSTDDLEGNLKAAREWVGALASDGAKLVALPENFAYLRREGEAIPCAQDERGEIVTLLRDLAREHAIWLVGGTYPERIPGDSRVYNSCLLLSPEGEICARYRKIHLFDVDLGVAGGAYRESDVIAPGDEVVVASTPFGPLGLSICYDLRFPELYRRLADRGARWIVVPSAFTPETGKDHWEVLLRARAIENQAFVLAPAQCGRHSPERASYGRSVVIDPWGLVLARAVDAPGVILADCDPRHQDEIRRRIPALDNRRL